MTDTPVRQTLSPNPDPQSKRVFNDVITSPQGRSQRLERPPKSLLEWLVRVHLRLMALELEEHKKSS